MNTLHYWHTMDYYFQLQIRITARYNLRNAISVSNRTVVVQTIALAAKLKKKPSNASSHKPLLTPTMGSELLHRDRINGENRVLGIAQIHLFCRSFQSSRVSLPITLLLTLCWVWFWIVWAGFNHLKQMCKVQSVGLSSYVKYFMKSWSQN